MIALGAAVLDLLVARHGLHVLPRPLLINPLGKPPHLLRYLFERDVRLLTHRLSDRFLEIRAPLDVVQEDPGIPKTVIELLLHAAHAGDRAVDLRVPGQHDEDGGGAGGGVQDGVLTAGVEGRVERLRRAGDGMGSHVEDGFQDQQDGDEGDGRLQQRRRAEEGADLVAREMEERDGHGRVEGGVGGRDLLRDLPGVYDEETGEEELQPHNVVVFWGEPDFLAPLSAHGVDGSSIQRYRPTCRPPRAMRDADTTR